MQSFLNSFLNSKMDLGLFLECIPLIDLSLRKLEGCMNMLVPSVLKGNKRIVLNNITPILRKLGIAGLLYRYGNTMMYDEGTKTPLEVAMILSRELMFLLYLNEQYISTLIKIKFDAPGDIDRQFRELSDKIDELKSSVNEQLDKTSANSREFHSEEFCGKKDSLTAAKTDVNDCRLDLMESQLCLRAAGG